MDDHVCGEDFLCDRDKLITVLKNLQAKCEKYEQENYSLRKSEIALKAVQDDLYSEVDLITNSYENKIQALTLKYDTLIQQQNEKLSGVVNDYESHNNSVCEENKELRDKLAETFNKLESIKSMTRNTVSELELKHQTQLEEIKVLNEQKLLQLTEVLDNTMLENRQLKERCDILNEESSCAKENLNYKKHEIDQLKEHILELQEQLSIVQVNQNSKPIEKHEERGNSLFAEVNDRRLKLEHIVRQQKASCIEMRRQFSKAIRENISVRTEVISFNTKLNDLLMTIGLEDDRFHRAYEDFCFTTKIRIQELQDKVACLQKENVQNSNVNVLYDVLDKTRNELARAESRIDKLCFEKLRLEEKIYKMSKDIHRWKLESMKYAAEISKLKLHISDLKLDPSVLSKLEDNIFNNMELNKDMVEDNQNSHSKSKCNDAEENKNVFESNKYATDLSSLLDDSEKGKKADSFAEHLKDFYCDKNSFSNETESALNLDIEKCAITENKVCSADTSLSDGVNASSSQAPSTSSNHFEIYEDTISLGVESKHSRFPNLSEGHNNLDSKTCLSDTISKKNILKPDDTVAIYQGAKCYFEEGIASSSNFNMYENSVFEEPKNTLISSTSINSSNVNGANPSNAFEIYEDTICISTDDKASKPINDNKAIMTIKPSLSFEIHEDTICLQSNSILTSTIVNPKKCVSDKTDAVILPNMEFSSTRYNTSKTPETSVHERRNKENIILDTIDDNSETEIITKQRPSILKKIGGLLPLENLEDNFIKKEVKFCNSVKSPVKSDNFKKSNIIRTEEVNNKVRFIKGDPSKALVVKKWKPK